MQLTSKTVSELIIRCLYDSNELSVPGVVPSGAVVVETVRSKWGFDPTKLDDIKHQIRVLLNEMPDSFHQELGGGASFLAACMDKGGRQWGEHHNIDELLALGLAAGYVSYCLPRDHWYLLPGGMPYFVISKDVRALS